MISLSVDIKSKNFPGHGTGKKTAALQDLHFTVTEGEFACLVGPSGCGKTTLLNIISGLDTEVNGSAWLKSGDGRVHPEEVSIGYMFQTPRLLPWLSVLENVRIVMDPAGVQAGEAERLLEEMGLSHVMQAFPNRLSGGMQRRAALARAFAVRPKLLLMDEPFVSLDAPTAERLRTLLLDSWKTRRTTVLFVTHDLSEAIHLGDRILFLSQSPGSVVLDLRVPLPRPRDPHDPKIEDFRKKLLADYPKLLAGLASAPQGPEKPAPASA